MNTNSEKTNVKHDDSGLAEGIIGLGTAWARYGLRLGSAALEANSKQLESYGKLLGEALASTAKSLTSIADSLVPERREEKVEDKPVDMTSPAA